MVLPSETDHVISSRIRQRRLMVGMSQTALARAVGVTFQQVQKYENGRNRITAGRLKEIADALSLPVADFFEAEKWSTRESADIEALATTREGIELVLAFQRIGDRVTRDCIVKLVKAIAAVEPLTFVRTATDQPKGVVGPEPKIER